MSNINPSELNPQVAKLLQSIFSKSWTASTALGLAKAAKRDEIPQLYADLDEVIELGLNVGHDSVTAAYSEAEEIAELLGIEIKTPTSLEILPVFANDQDQVEMQS